MNSSDGYTKFINKPLPGRIAKALGLPRPVPLRRHVVGAPLVEGPILVLGETPVANAAAKHLYDNNYDVHRVAGIKQKFSAIIVGLDSVETPADLADPMLTLGQTLRSSLGRNGRVIVLARAPETEATENNPKLLAARQGVEGTTRSVAHEMRAGSTANGLVLGENVAPNAPSVIGALNFLLSGRSAYVSGQFIRVDTDAGAIATDIDRPLAGQAIVVTGAARGIGAAIVRTLSRDGATVVGVDMPQAGDSLAAVMNEVGGSALQMDITADNAGQRMIDFCAERYGSLDGFVHNAGITRDKMLANMDDSRWNSVMAVNILAPLTINEALLAARGNGVVAADLRIVSLASTSGIAGNRGQTNYSASKAGVIGMTAATADALAETGGSINAVAPGFIETDMTAAMPMATREVARRMNSLQQGGRPVDVAEAISFLISDGAAGINGTTLRVCGQSMVGQ